MFPGYEQFWAAILDDPGAASDMLGRDPYPHDVNYARVAAETPHLVLSNTLSDPSWPTARIIHDIDEAIRQQAGGTTRRPNCSWAVARVSALGSDGIGGTPVGSPPPKKTIRSMFQPSTWASSRSA